MALTNGQLLHARYEIQALLGQGGMGAVYRAHDRVLNHSCAVKELVPPPGLTASQIEGLRQQFRQEAQVLANLDHPSLPHVIDYFSDGHNEYLVMDFIEGESLETLIAKAGRRGIKEERILAWTSQLLQALAYCHARGVIHRDIKPANILICPDPIKEPNGRAVLVDFGLVKQWDPQDPGTRTAMRGLGTPEYAPPEQYHGKAGHTEPRSDIYALGATLYHALTGQAPPTATMRMASPGDFHPPRTFQQGISPRTEIVVLKAMELPLEQRFSSAEQMATSLFGTAVLPGRPLPQRKKMPVLFRVAMTVVLGILVLGACLAVIIFTSWPIDLKTLVGWVTDTPIPIALPLPTPTPAPTSTPSPSQTAIPTPTPTSMPEPTNTTTATATAMPEPTSTPLLTETFLPTTPPSPTNTPGSTSVPVTADPGVITNFEVFGTWRRGDEPNGTITQSKSQVHQGAYAAALNYSFTTTSNDYVVFIQLHSIVGRPKRITAWVYGDGSGHFLNVWIKDSGGQVWQVPLGRVDHAGWQQMVGMIDTNQDWPWTHISGMDNGLVDYPVSFQALILDDNPDPFTGTGTLYIDDLRADAERVLPTGSPRPTERAEATPSSPGSSAGRIAFTVYNAGIGSYTLYTVKPDGKGLHALADYVHQPDYSPDGMHIVVDGVGGGRDDLWRFRHDGSSWQQLTTHPDDHFPTWSRNGLTVVFSSSRQGDGVYRLYIGDSPVGTDKTKFIIGDYPVLLPNWEIVFNGCDYGWGIDTRCGLWRASQGHTPARTTGNPQDIPTDGTSSEILFLRPDGDNWDIYRTDLGGGNVVQLTDSPGRDGPATFSPDGSTIAFLSERSGTWALYTMNRQGSGVKKLLDLPMGGNYDAAPYPWTSERISWGGAPVGGPTAMPTEDSRLLPAPQITFPIPDDVVSASKPTTVQWSWSQRLAFNQGFEVRFWHTSESSPMGVASPTADTQLEVNFGLTDAYRRHSQGFYYLDVVVVQLDSKQVLSKSARIRVKADPNK